MKKVIVLLSVSILILLTSMLLELQTVKAATEQHVSIEVTSGSYTTFVNQRVELTARTNDWGTPPYEYQWYTIFIPQDVLDRGFPILPDGRLVKIKVSGANSSVFEFSQSTPGTYNINLEVIDSNGNDAQVSSNFIVVQELPSPSPASNPTPTPTIPELQTWTIPMLLSLMLATTGLLVYHKRRAKQFSPETFTGLSQRSCTRSLITKTLPTKDW
jgi:hypothetical protein